MNEQPEALRLANELCEAIPGYSAPTSLENAAARELRRLFELAHDQHTVIYGLRLSVLNLQHNNELLTNAVWKACGDDEQVVNDTIESQGELK